MILEDKTRVEKKNSKLVMNLQLFADGGSGDKTEQATPKKKEKAREDGQVAKSVEVTTAMMLVTLFATIKLWAGSMAQRLIEIMQKAFLMIEKDEMSIGIASEIYGEFLIDGMLVVLPIFGVAVVVATIANVLQVGWHPTAKPLTPKLNRMSPIQGFKRLFSMKVIVDLFKSILKIVIILLIVYNELRDYEKLITMFYEIPVFDAYIAIGNIVLDIGIQIGMFFIIVAGIDYAYTRYKHEKDLKMTKQEIKEERKLADGNPEVKGRIRQRMREAAMRRMMQDLPKADVIITNPTHFAIAVEYNEFSGGAPKVIAKGADLMAARIREKAKEFEIEIVENKPLARTLYYTVDIGDEIPPDLYQAVAEVLAFVYSLKNRSQST